MIKLKILDYINYLLNNLIASDNIHPRKVTYPKDRKADLMVFNLLSIFSGNLYKGPSLYYVWVFLAFSRPPPTPVRKSKYFDKPHPSIT